MPTQTQCKAQGFVHSQPSRPTWTARFSRRKKAQVEVASKHSSREPWQKEAAMAAMAAMAETEAVTEASRTELMAATSPQTGTRPTIQNSTSFKLVSLLIIHIPTSTSGQMRPRSYGKMRVNHGAWHSMSLSTSEPMSLLRMAILSLATPV